MLVIFDWDGTLCDSASRIIAAMQSATEACDLTPPSDESVRNIIGLGLPEAIASLYPGLAQDTRARVQLTYSQRFVALDHIPNDLFAGAMDTLEALRQRGYLLAVATGKSRRGLDRVLQELGLSHFFDASRCADETLSKPDPLMLNELLQDFELQPNQALMVGDTEFDLEMAAVANMPSVGVSFGSHSVERLQRHGPVSVIDRLPELLDINWLSAVE